MSKAIEALDPEEVATIEKMSATEYDKPKAIRSQLNDLWRVLRRLESIQKQFQTTLRQAMANTETKEEAT